MAEKRKDNAGRVLKEGERQKANGSYEYRWRTKDGKRHSIYAKTLSELREKEQDVQKDKRDGIKTEYKNVSLNDIYDMWVLLKRGLKDNTFQNYQYMYNLFVRPDFGNIKIAEIRKTDVRRFYNLLAEERKVKISTIDSIHTVIHQVLDLAVEDEYIRNNPSNSALKELKQSHNFETEKRKALTMEEQALFMDFLQTNNQYSHWKPIFTVMLGTGLRVGEVTGLRWDDIDFEENTIEVRRTLVYYNHSKGGCYFSVNTPKTKAGKRTIPMIDSVKNAFLEEKRNQEERNLSCQVKIDGLNDFVFINRFGNVQHQGTLNKALRRIMKECNQEILDKSNGNENLVLLPRFSCHNLRHTFTTRLCEAGTNTKVIQNVLGHSDIRTTLDIYADVTKDLRNKEFISLDDFLQSSNVV